MGNTSGEHFNGHNGTKGKTTNTHVRLIHRSRILLLGGIASGTGNRSSRACRSKPGFSGREFFQAWSSCSLARPIPAQRITKAPDIQL